MVVNEVKNLVSNCVGRGCNAEFVNLTEEEDMGAVDLAGVEAWLVSCRAQSNQMENFVCMFFSETWSFRVTLHSGEDRYDRIGWCGWTTFVFSPPRAEHCIWVDVEALLWWRCFSKGIGHIRTIQDKVFSGGDRVEHPEKVWSGLLA